MGSETLLTRFAPALRANLEVVERQAHLFDSLELLKTFLDTCPYSAIIMNAERQIVFSNQAFLRLADAGHFADVLGLRAGEALRCVHVTQGPNGCGTSEFCVHCGAVNATLSAQSGLRDAQECRIARSDGSYDEAIELLVSASPVLVTGERLVIATLVDISHEKRRRALERIFFHDILDAAGGIQGLAEALSELVVAAEPAAFVDLLSSSAHALVAEIRSQQQLLGAETGDLAITIAPLCTLRMLRSLTGQYATHKVAQGRAIQIDPAAAKVEIATDVSLLTRVLGNMLKNALEASQAEETVIIGCAKHADGVEFWVHNAAVIPSAVQLQLFQRSFSTKGTGRGLGTYSMKLLTERYLGGRVGFRSAPGEGTTFFALYPTTLGT